MFDDSWKSRVLQGDARAATELVEHLAEPLYAFCFSRVGRNSHVCEDVVQETFLQALRQLPDYQPHRSGNRLFPWLTGLARNEIRRVHRQQRRHIPASQIAGSLSGEDVASRTAWEHLCDDVCHDAQSLARQQREETLDDLQAALHRLPEHYVRALQAKYLDGRTVREIASAQRCSEKSVESLLTRARSALRKSLERLTDDAEPVGDTSACSDPGCTVPGCRIPGRPDSVGSASVDHTIPTSSVSLP